MYSNECQRCGSTEFTEENGHLYCMHCNTQTQGFAKEVAADEDEFAIPSREVHTQSKDPKKSNKQVRSEHSKWTTVQAYNIVYLTMIEDFYEILQKQKCNISRKRFFNVAMQIWFGYLKQSEIIFRSDEHINKTIKLHPASHYRDKFLLGTTTEVSTNAEHLPMFSHSSLHMIKEEQERNLLSHGSNYVTRAVDRVEPNNEYYTENDEQKAQYLDPRQYSVDGLDEKLTSHPTYLQQILNFQKEGDDFESFIRAIVKGNTDVSSIVVKNEEPDTSMIAIEQNVKIEDEDSLLENQNYEELLLQRMPSTSKNLNKVVPLNRMKNYKIASSPMINDLVNKPKLLSFLFITVRLLNFNVYLSDLIRWCIQGNIRYIDALLCLPKNWEIMWNDFRAFRDYRVPAYHTIATLTRHMINHCDLALQMFPQPDIRPLVKRFISDLNLPKDLLDVVVIKYDRFIARKLNKKESALMKLMPDFEVIALLAIIFTLRDLFDLLGTTTQFIAIQNCSEDELFNWEDWLEYSITRLSAIKTFILNLNIDFDNRLHNIGELLTTSNIFFEPKEKKAYRIFKHRSPEHREILRESFEMLFERNDASTMNNIKSKLSEKIPATLYPLKTYTNLVCPLIKNSLIQSVLKQSFCHKRTLPFIYEDGSTFHDPVKFNEHIYFNQKNVNDFFHNHLSDGLAHLFDLAAILSTADLKRYFSYFTEAEMKRPVTQKMVKILSQSLSN